ncbi:MAG: hypothetical protein PHY31_00495 [Smithellaceae bacterium]|nr:hypothetical protein [Smithellaceae bacterium]
MANKKSALLSLFVVLVFLLHGCAAMKMGTTKNLPPTVMPQPAVSTAKIGKIRIAVLPFDVANTEIRGGHYEGLAQVKQPWIWGLSDQQRQAMYGDLKNVARYAFIDELIRRGLKVVVPEEHQAMLNL